MGLRHPFPRRVQECHAQVRRSPHHDAATLVIQQEEGFRLALLLRQRPEVGIHGAFGPSQRVFPLFVVHLIGQPVLHRPGKVRIRFVKGREEVEGILSIHIPRGHQDARRPVFSGLPCRPRFHLLHRLARRPIPDIEGLRPGVHPLRFADRIDNGQVMLLFDLGVLIGQQLRSLVRSEFLLFRLFAQFLIPGPILLRHDPLGHAQERLGGAIDHKLLSLPPDIAGADLGRAIFVIQCSFIVQFHQFLHAAFGAGHSAVEHTHIVQVFPRAQCTLSQDHHVGPDDPLYAGAGNDIGSIRAPEEIVVAVLFPVINAHRRFGRKGTGDDTAQTVGLPGIVGGELLHRRIPRVHPVQQRDKIVGIVVIRHPHFPHPFSRVAARYSCPSASYARYSTTVSVRPKFPSWASA